ncbi:GatB/YqeY domain-containing protein [Candidatus Nomurabacteria bacterium]|nr:GatB/YqeY domain-containing protein [Candidatus Nomurabacteria bacterium]
MELLEKIEQDFKEALRTKQELKLSVLRMLKTSLKNQAIADKKPETEMSEQDIFLVLKRELKKRNDAVASFEQGNRPELAAQERQEAEILSAYLPAAMSEEELQKIVDEVIAGGVENFGQAMKEIMQRTQGQADGQVVQALVKAKLAN